LRSDWTDAWERADGPDPLPMPLQSMISEPALRRVDAVAAGGHAGAARLATYFVGQGVGLLDTVRPASRVVQDFMEDIAMAVERLQRAIDWPARALPARAEIRSPMRQTTGSADPADPS
jgi:NAD(P)H-dependent flavin oxidoreductase YrpB (nitropropane dioxygenase family)